MSYSDEDLLMISSLQHFMFCERQCALIHLEQIWADNIFTIQGELLHKRAHSETFEQRPKKKTEFGIPVRSLKYGITGKVDAVEFHTNGNIILVEYKRGSPKIGKEDEVQLCAQALCLEEMKETHIDAGAIYYGKTRRRHQVVFDENLREATVDTINKTRSLLESRKTPPPNYKKNCKRCSLYEYCLPEKMSKKRLNVKTFLKKQLLIEDSNETNA